MNEAMPQPGERITRAATMDLSLETFARVLQLPETVKIAMIREKPLSDTVTLALYGTHPDLPEHAGGFPKRVDAIYERDADGRARFVRFADPPK